MLTILLIYFIGKYFYTLADDYNKNKWLYAVIGVLFYYFGAMVIGGVFIGLADALIGLGINWENDFGLGLMVMPFGIGFVSLLYYLLKKKWEKTFVKVRDEIQDIGNSINKIDY